MLDWLISKGSFYIYIYYSVKIIALICIVVTYSVILAYVYLILLYLIIKKYY